MTENTESGKKKMETAPKLFIGCGVLVLVLILVVYFGSLHFCKKVGLDAGLMSRNPALAAAKLLITSSPELDLVKLDEKKGTMTIRNKETGEVVTVDFRDVQEGRIVFKGKDGEVTFSGDEKGFSVKGKEGEVTVRGDEKGLSVKSEDGEMTFGGDEEGFRMEVTDEKGEKHSIGFGVSADESRIPDWVPRWAGKLQVIFISSNQDQESGSFTIESDAKPDEVLSLVRSRLENQGFEVNHTSISTGEGTAHIVVGTSETPNRTVTVQLGIEDGRSKAAVTFARN